MLLRRLWDQWELGTLLDREAAEVPGHCRPSLMVELRTALLLAGGGWMDDLKQFAARGVRRLFGWKTVPDPTTFGRWLRRAVPDVRDSPHVRDSTSPGPFPCTSCDADRTIYCVVGRAGRSLAVPGPGLAPVSIWTET